MTALLQFQFGLYAEISFKKTEASLTQRIFAGNTIPEVRKNKFKYGLGITH